MYIQGLAWSHTGVSRSSLALILPAHFFFFFLPSYQPDTRNHLQFKSHSCRIIHATVMPSKVAVFVQTSPSLWLFLEPLIDRKTLCAAWTLIFRTDPTQPSRVVSILLIGLLNFGSKSLLYLPTQIRFPIGGERVTSRGSRLT